MFLPPIVSARVYRPSVEHYGKVDKLIYCAGKQVVKPHRMADIKDFDSLYDVNLRGALFTSKLFCSAKVSEKTAVFCAISSIAAIRPEPGIVGYSVMKAALDSMIKGLAKEARSSSVRWSCAWLARNRNDSCPACLR